MLRANARADLQSRLTLMKTSPSGSSLALHSRPTALAVGTSRFETLGVNERRRGRRRAPRPSHSRFTPHSRSEPHGSGLHGDRVDRCPVPSPFSGLRRVSRVPSGRFGTPSDGGAPIAEDRPPAQNPHQAFHP